MSRHLVFVYGSLKAGFHNNRVLVDQDAARLGDAVTVDLFLLLRGQAFPFLINPRDWMMAQAWDGLSRVAGELYRVDDAGLAALDRLEGHPRFYKREKIMVAQLGADADAIVTAAWAYFLTGPSERGITRDRISADDLCDRDAQGVASWQLADVYQDAADADASEQE